MGLLLAFLKGNWIVLLKWGLIISIIGGITWKLTDKWNEAELYKTKYESAQKEIADWKIANAKLIEHNKKLETAIKLDKEKTKKIEKDYETAVADLKTLQEKYNHVKKFTNITIPTELNHWMLQTYSTHCTKGSKTQRTRCLLERSKASRMVSDLLSFTAKYKRALSRCNRNIAVVRSIIRGP